MRPVYVCDTAQELDNSGLVLAAAALLTEAVALVLIGNCQVGPCRSTAPDGTACQASLCNEWWDDTCLLLPEVQAPSEIGLLHAEQSAWRTHAINWEVINAVHSQSCVHPTPTWCSGCICITGTLCIQCCGPAADAHSRVHAALS
jgi:hypothetical protein